MVYYMKVNRQSVKCGCNMQHGHFKRIRNRQTRNTGNQDNLMNRLEVNVDEK